MSWVFSTALANALLNNTGSTNGLGQKMTSCKIALYGYASGGAAISAPATADAASTGAVLARIAVNGSGGTWATSASGACAKTASEVWNNIVSSVISATAGTLVYFRIYLPASEAGSPASPDAADATQFRIQGLIGTGTGELQVPSVAVTLNQSITIDALSVKLPITGP